ncbi:unnamed protein product [Cyclocybe aegerita]|uniref:Uncharacterized protein n=1 Tax=Cyclocybe aegerita TaxID=1973307 RepID=A0A8S0WRM4_CYCAE|nr:unnamed protein product [Cyclocybe aegerita]
MSNNCVILHHGEKVGQLWEHQHSLKLFPARDTWVGEALDALSGFFCYHRPQHSFRSPNIDNPGTIQPVALKLTASLSSERSLPSSISGGRRIADSATAVILSGGYHRIGTPKGGDFWPCSLRDSLNLNRSRDRRALQGIKTSLKADRKTSPLIGFYPIYILSSPPNTQVTIMQKIAISYTFVSILCAVGVQAAAISSLSGEASTGFPTDLPLPSGSIFPSGSITAFPNATAPSFPIPTAIVNGIATYIICPPFPSGSDASFPSGLSSDLSSNFLSPTGTIPDGDSFPTDIPSPSGEFTVTLEPTAGAFPSGVVFPSGSDASSAFPTGAPFPSTSLPSDALVPSGSAPWNPCGYPFPSSFPGNGTFSGSLPIPTGTVVPGTGIVFPSATYSVEATAEPSTTAN